MIVLIIAIVLILANSLHVVSAWFNRPAGTYFTGIAHYYTDYFLYTSLMAQKGWVFTQHLFTNESLSPTWIYWLYTLLGKLGNPFVIYNVSIVVFSAFLLFLWWKIITQVTADKFTRIISFLFLTTASGFTGFDFWFSPLPALNRLGGVPHQIFQTILLLSVLLLSVQLTNTSWQKLSFVSKAKLWSGKPSILYAFLMVGVSFLAATANPIQMLLLSLAIILTNPRLLPFFIPAAAGALLTNAAFVNDPILIAAKVWENNQHISVSLWQFILALGPIALLIPFGIKPFLFVIPGARTELGERATRNPSALQRVLFSYCALSILVFFSPLPSLLGTSPVRLLSPAAYTILPILASLGLTRISSQLWSDRRKVDYFVKGILFCLYIAFTVPSLVGQIRSRMNAPRDLLYIPNVVVQNLRNLKGDGSVLTDPKTPYDVLVPVLTGRKTFSGHPIHTLYPEIKEELRRKYFEGRMTEEEKQKFLKDHNIGAVYEP